MFTLTVWAYCEQTASIYFIDEQPAAAALFDKTLTPVLQGRIKLI